MLAEALETGRAVTAPAAPPALAIRSDAGEIDDLTLRRARQGDTEAFTALVRRYERRVFALVGRMLTRRPDLVDDLAQETFVRVLTGIARFDPAGPARLSTWILTVATRLCIDVLRRAPRAEAQPLVDEPQAPDDPEAITVHRDLGRRVQAAMAALPEDQRAVLVLRAYHDFDYDEIATALGVELGTVKSRLGRARIALRAALESKETP